eukprot:gnl/TRDRNA2_/TRDRNA2_71744_c0_seq2.p1 gnl/TRDRNA2_/TRDRNA2_71744_c0~~gnl/TRDRNA2_/TRDRNA2_71744_c0_seq2.p1  ORF type:complete len:176 (+),score=13.12 gnl/TRDRNA2_/TRDRNA2_71744_c0_seq2:22-528(+)
MRREVSNSEESKAKTAKLLAVEVMWNAEAKMGTVSERGDQNDTVSELDTTGTYLYRVSGLDTSCESKCAEFGARCAGFAPWKECKREDYAGSSVASCSDENIWNNDLQSCQKISATGMCKGKFPTMSMCCKCEKTPEPTTMPTPVHTPEPTSSPTPSPTPTPWPDWSE